MKRICIIYLRTTKYILPVVEGLSKKANVDFISSPAAQEEGWGKHQLPTNDHIRWMDVKHITPFGNRFGQFQTGLVRYMLRDKPDAVIIFANPRFLSYWAVLFAGKILRIPVYSRGHGLYKKVKLTTSYRIMYSLMINLSEKYLCYTDSVKDTLLPLVKNPDKLAVDYNTQYNDYPVHSEEKTGKEKGILFIGRLRPRCEIENLVAVMQNLRSTQPGFDLELHIVGDGVLGNWARETAKENLWIHYHGMVYEDRQIQEISRACRFGVFPGDAGLSVVHMMSLSLPPMTHNYMYTHMGPEPSYIRHGENGWFYNRDTSIQSLETAVAGLAKISPEEMKGYQKRAFETYLQLAEPPFHERLWKILNLGE